MEAWRKVFREGFVPLLTEEHLLHLKKGLEEDDPRLLQGATTLPPPLAVVQDWPVEAACLTCYPWAMANGGISQPRASPEEYNRYALEVPSVGMVEEEFAKISYEIDQRMGEPAAVRWLLNWWDETPREQVRLEVLAEVQLALDNHKK